MKKKTIGLSILASLAIIGLTGIALLSPIPQNQSYHNFSDTNTWLGIHNFWNVVSNLPFLLVGVFGLFRLNTFTSVRTQYLVFFLGVTLVSIGSGYYHLSPNDPSLVWDRLPMTIAFMALFSAVISEYLDLRIGRLLLFPALIVGLLSVIYWAIFNDLRFYAFVQFYPMIAIPILLIFIKAEKGLSFSYWLLLLFYLIAKVFEYFDYQVHELTRVLSGHSLKHIFAAMGILVFIFIRSGLKRRDLNKPLHYLTI